MKVLVFVYYTKNNTQKQELSLSTDIDNETVVINIKGDTKLKEDII
jgi:hypothetical protein